MNVKPSLEENVLDNKEIISSLIFYACGLLLGSLCFSYLKAPLSKAIKTIINYSNIDLLSLFFSRSGMYLFIFSLIVLLSISIVGFRFLNIIPLIGGIVLGLKISYLYSLSFKGFRYCAVMIIPESSIFMTVLLFAIKNSSVLSKFIYNNSIKKSDISYDINIASYLKVFLIYALVLIMTAFINSSIIYLLKDVIRI